jgi:RNA polymerase sigma factor (sigma-70 family)
MAGMNDQYDRCAAMVRQLNEELGWGLSSEEQQTYRDQLCTHLPDACTDPKLRAMIICYHQDHVLVQALHDSRHPAYDEAWQMWMTQVVAILKRAGLAWSSDAAVDLDDLVQIARVELVRSIASFQYQSRFSTWAYRVVVQSVQRYIRDSQALKRAVHPDSLEHLPEHDAPGYRGDYLEAHVDGCLLLERIMAFLAAQPDTRLARIFHLWAVNDHSTEEIGRLVQLSPARTRALLAQARALLRAHPDIGQWNDPPEP